MKPILFIDRDGTLIVEPQPSQQVDSYEKLAFLPGALRALYKIQHELGYDLVMVTNQDGLGTDSFPEDTFWGPHNLMLDICKTEGITFKEVLIDKTFAQEGASTRKPGTALAEHYRMYGKIKESYMVGDRETDIQFAENLGLAGGIAIEAEIPSAFFSAKDWDELYAFLANKDRVVQKSRKTRETDICLSLNLDGDGSADCKTGLGFLDHMLDQIARHGGVDLKVHCAGDLEVDEHHTVEDIGITFGEALKAALGDKRGIERYSFHLPMDEAAAKVLMDLSGRAYLRWEVEFSRERVGDVPTELFSHFFRSLADAAQMTLHIAADGENDHHIIEGVFKAFAKTLRQAVLRPDNAAGIPTTKGML